ncbi:MAG: DUF2306 domain-containing protein [Paracoccaceae bacterium]|nr:DUF2306 domain-containing protein [Paracoccaceae bacterium]
MADKWFLRIAAFFAIFVALVTYRFLLMPLEEAFGAMLDHIANRRTLFIMHISAAPIALAIGVFQLMPKIRRKWRGLHLWLGRIYGVAILIGGIGAMGIALTAGGGVWAQVGFSALGILWLGTTGRAIWLARDQRFAEHRIWMIRSFALTFAAVTLRLQLVGFEIAGMAYQDSSVWLAFTCWIPNLIVAELIIRNRPRIAI